ncbi:hypothetical protein BC936DRAFT_144187 [Jimgerdemannia flammicorona]|uniref:Uncharacterized protein n=1 Tax=Jimgerdemannia flammicorona TaxID=994334 RepID=A0A433DCV3_9FUNG|nr:hypothetical protein BC936DRAFT_144187 [Jimgerdemannia flammicorona]
MGRDPPELEQLVLLESLRKRDAVEIVEVVDRVPQARKVLFLNQEIVVRRVDGVVVGLLDRDQVWLDQRDVVRFLEDLDDARMIDAGSKGREEIAQEERLLVQVEPQGLQVANISKLDTLTIISLNAECSHASTECSIMDVAELSNSS